MGAIAQGWTVKLAKRADRWDKAGPRGST
jgi:hypothetical protein